MKRCIFLVSVALILFSFTCCKKDKAVTLPTITTQDVINITENSATVGGTINYDGNGEISECGICWIDGFQQPTIANNKIICDPITENFTLTLSGLDHNTTYTVRAFARNSAGIAYGVAVTFMTIFSNIINFNTSLNYDTVSDIDGNVYKTIAIGTQTWMAENLKTTHYNNGDAIPNIIDDAQWVNLTTGAYCRSMDDPTYTALFGTLYNFYTVDDPRNLCPLGWHAPSDADWTILINNWGILNAGSKLKETGSAHWKHNEYTDNSSGFTALPGAARFETFYLFLLGEVGLWWCTDEADTANAFYYGMQSDYSDVLRDSTFKYAGLSVRCVKD